MLTFGVEIEFIAPPGVTRHSAARRIAADTGLECYDAGYTHRGTTSWKIVSDASLGATEGSGHELVSPVLTLDTIDQIDRVCGVLASIGCSVNPSCGLHVHIGAGGLSIPTLKRLAALYAESEEVIDSLLPPSRRGSRNGYCRSIKDSLSVAQLARATDVREIAAAVSNGERKFKLNYLSYYKYGTVEFRHHSSTIDPVKIKNWVYFCMKMVEASQREEHLAPRTAPPIVYGFDLAMDRSGSMSNSPRGYWSSGRRTRTIHAMLTRPAGATAVEVAAELNVGNAPDLGWHINRAREAGETVHYTATPEPGRRGRVYRIVEDPAAVVREAAAARYHRRVGRPTPAAVAAAVVEVVTLDSLLNRLRLEPNERTYWVERAAMLAGRD